MSAAPIPALSLPATVYSPGQLVTATLSATDADTRSESIPGGTDPDGLDTTVTIERHDSVTITSAVWVKAGTALAVDGLKVSGPAPAVSDTLRVELADRQKHLVTIEQAITVRPPMLVGMSVPAGQVAAHAAQFKGMKGPGRVFRAPGKGLPPWAAVLAECLPGAVPAVSFKDMPAPAVLVAWLDDMPEDLPLVLISYHHEPEGDAGLTPAQYAADWHTVQAIVEAHPNRKRIMTVPILTLYWARHKGNWRTWWPGVGDAIGWDCYPEVNTTGYEAPATFFAIPVAAARELGLDVVITELGAPLATGTDGNLDPASSPRRAAWMTRCVDYLDRLPVDVSPIVRCFSVSWWCNTGQGGKTMHIDAYAPEAAAWQAAAKR
jgi:hypothetical protein